jgi:hypothetical protein
LQFREKYGDIATVDASVTRTYSTISETIHLKNEEQQIEGEMILERTPSGWKVKDFPMPGVRAASRAIILYDEGPRKNKGIAVRPLSLRRSHKDSTAAFEVRNETQHEIVGGAFLTALTFTRSNVHPIMMATVPPSEKRLAYVAWEFRPLPDNVEPTKTSVRVALKNRRGGWTKFHFVLDLPEGSST